MLKKYSIEITNKFPELYDSIQNSYLRNTIFYYINSNVRNSVNLKKWLKGLISNPSQELINISNTIVTSDDYDKQVINCLKYVRDNIVYKGDLPSWDSAEYWQTPTETINRLTGDCEDGAILLYCLCRLKGVPSNRLLLFCGDVSGGSHCWLGYKPREYPLNLVFLDWCYWYKSTSVEYRNKFYINDNKIRECTFDAQEISSNYYNTWFAFNEDTNVTKYKYDNKYRIQNMS